MFAASDSKQTEVTNMTIKRMLEKKLFSLYLTFRMSRHTSSEVTVNRNTSNN